MELGSPPIRTYFIVVNGFNILDENHINKSMQKLIIIVLLCFCTTLFYAQQAPLYVNKGDALFSMAKLTDFKEDKTWKQSLADIQKDTSFIPMTQDLFKLGGKNPRNSGYIYCFSRLAHHAKATHAKIPTRNFGRTRTNLRQHAHGTAGAGRVLSAAISQCRCRGPAQNQSACQQRPYP